MRKYNDEAYQLAKDQELVKIKKNKRSRPFCLCLFNKRMNGHRSDHAKKTLLSVSQHVVSPGHSLEDFTRSKIYIIEPSMKV
jgi:hypothetical protein